MTYPLITLPAGVTFDYKKTPKYQTIIQTPQSGIGQVRASLQQSPIYEWELTWNYLKEVGVSTANDFQYLHDFFAAVNGSFGAFVFDPSLYNLERLSVVSNVNQFSNGFSGIAPPMNYLPWSTDITQSVWDKHGNGTTAPAFVEFSSGTPGSAYPGMVSVYSFPAVPGTSGDYTKIDAGVAIPFPLTGNTFTFSVWIYVPSTDTITIDIADSPESQSATTTAGLATGWNHISVSHTFTSTTATSIYVDIQHVAGQAASTFVGIYNPQLEVGSSAGPLCQTYATSLPGQTAFQLWRSSAVFTSSINTLIEMIQNVSLLAGIYVNSSLVSGSAYTQTNFPAVVTFNVPPVAGSPVVWAGNFNYLVHFAEDSLEFTEFMWKLWSQGGVKLESVIL